MGGLFGGVLAALLLRYAFPIWFALPKEYAESGPSPSDLEKRFAGRGAPFVWAGVAGLIAALAWCGFVALIASVAGSRGKGEAGDMLVQEGPIYFISALFGALGALLWGFNIALRLLLRSSGVNGEDEYPFYVRQQNLKHNYQLNNVSSVMGTVTLVLSCIFLFLTADNYTRFAPDNIGLNPLMSVGETRHRYGDVTRIVMSGQMIAPNGNTVNRQIYIIHFKNGDRWDSDNAPGDPEKYNFARIVQSVSQKSGVKVQQYNVLPREEL